MKYFILFMAVSFSGIAANASDKKTVSVIRGIYSESLVNDTLIIDSCPNDTVIYTGVFNLRGDSVSISISTTEKIDVFVRPMSHNQYTTYFYCNNQVVDSLNVRYENGSVFINEDYYILSYESYNNFIKERSVLALSHLIIDCLGDYPQDILKLLNLNWGIDFYQCHIEKAVTVVQSPHSDMKYKFESIYIYDKHNEFIEIIQKDRYTRKAIKRDQHQIQYLITYNYGDRLSGEYTQTHMIGYETIEGNYTQVPSQQEFIYKQTFQVVDTLANVFNPPGFGMCKKSWPPKPCTPMVTQWSGFYDGMTVNGNSNLLTDSSKGTCAMGIPGYITFQVTGQILIPGLTQMKQAVAQQININMIAAK